MNYTKEEMQGIKNRAKELIDSIEDQQHLVTIFNAISLSKNPSDASYLHELNNKYFKAIRESVLEGEKGKLQQIQDK